MTIAGKARKEELEKLTKAQLVELIEQERQIHDKSLSGWRQRADEEASSSTNSRQENSKLKKLLGIIRDLIDYELGTKLPMWTAIALTGGGIIAAYFLSKIAIA